MLYRTAIEKSYYVLAVIDPRFQSSSRRVLLVDDDKGVSDVLKIGLERQGFVVDAFNEPSSALLNLDQQQEEDDGYCAAIFDIRMPRMSGFELYREFSSKVEGKTPVCFLSATAETYQSEFDELFPDAKVKEFLRKPIGIKELAEHLDELCTPTVRNRSRKQVA